MEKKKMNDLYIKDLNDGSVRPYGSDKHDSLYIINHGRMLAYSHLQNGDGSAYGDYRIVDNPAGKEYDDIDNNGEPVYVNIGGFVDVTFCQNCKHWDSENGKIGYCRNMKFGHISKWIEIDICKKTKFDFFCAAGERPDIKEIMKGLKDV
jgi:hypothetical protein